MTDRRRLFKQIGAVSLIGIVAQAAFLIANLLLQRYLDKADYGRVDIANKIINLAGYLGLIGVNTALLRAVPRRDLPLVDWPGVLRRVVVTAALVAALAGGLAVFQFQYSAGHAVLIGVAALCLSVAVAAASVLAIDLKFAEAQWVQQLWRPVLFGGILLLVAAGRLSVDTVLLLYAAAGILSLILVFRTLAPVTRGSQALPMGRLVREGAVFFGLFLTSSLMLRLDAFFIKGYLSWEDAARYGVASNLALTGYGILATGVAQVIMPRIASGDRLRLTSLLMTITLLAVGAGALIVSLGTPFIHLVSDRYPGDFRPLLLILCLSGIIQVAYVIPSAWLGALAPEPALRLFLAVNVLSLGINVALNSFLIPRWQLEGAAIATAISWLCRLGWAIAFVLWIRRIRNTRRQPPTAAEASEAAIIPAGGLT